MTECSANEQGTEQKGPSDLQRSTSDCRQSSSGMRRTPSTRSRKLSSSSLTPFGSAVALLEDAKDESMELSRPAPPPDPEKRKQLEEKMSQALGTTSDGLLALLRDHPELVSSELAKEAERVMPEEFSGSYPRNRSISSYPATPHGDGNVQSMLFPSNDSSMPCSPQMLPQDSRTPPPWNTTQPFSLPEAVREAFSSMSESGMPSVIRHSHSLLSRTASTTPNLGHVSKPHTSEEKIVVAMVGLPARGKSYLSNKLMRYLRWREYKVKVFNVGQLRRAQAKARMERTGIHEEQMASFFDSANEKARQMREELANECLEQLIRWLRRSGNVGIHDATNTTKERRRLIAERVAQEPGMRLVFLESICTDPKVIADNIAVKVRSGDPDYANMSRDRAKEDFLRRIKHYENVYETLDEDGTESHYTYCKIVDVGRLATLNLINGYLESQIAFYLLNLHVSPRNIFISRHGESVFNVEGKIGGDSDLSERGWAYARALPKLIQDNLGDAPLTVWHSSLRRTGQTASFLNYPKLVWNSLDELDAGVCDSMTYEEIERFYPEDSANRDEDKFNYRYRGGESYRDLLVRLEPIIMELERQDNIFIIGHQAILRAIYAYFMGYDQNELPYIKIPLHTVIKLTPKAYGCDEEQYRLPISAVDTHRARPTHTIPSNADAAASNDDGDMDESMKAAMSMPPSQRRPT